MKKIGTLFCILLPFFFLLSSCVPNAYYDELKVYIPEKKNSNYIAQKERHNGIEVYIWNMSQWEQEKAQDDIETNGRWNEMSDDGETYLQKLPYRTVKEQLAKMDLDSSYYALFDRYSGDYMTFSDAGYKANNSELLLDWNSIIAIADLKNGIYYLIHDYM